MTSLFFITTTTFKHNFLILKIKDIIISGTLNLKTYDFFQWKNIPLYRPIFMAKQCKMFSYPE